MKSGIILVTVIALFALVPETAMEVITSEFNGLERAGFATMSHTCDQVRAVPDEFRVAENMYPAVDNFYQKYTEAYGIPIFSSVHVSDDALKRLCYLVRFMAAGHAAVREEVYAWFGRFVVVALNETTLDIPEYANVIQANASTHTGQNVGGTYNNPVTAVSESNLLCLPVDPYPVEADIGLHEMAHMFHNGGARFAIPGWQTRIKAAYTAAIASGKWSNTYAGSNVHEYFAQGCGSYYEVITHSDQPDGVYGPISNRTALLAYDPDLYHLIEEVFPCNNVLIDRCENDRDCYDKLRLCPWHAEQGYCTDPGSWTWCKKECDHCN